MRIKRVNVARKKRLFAEDFHSQEYLDFIHSKPCALCGSSRNIEAAHVRSRGAGGKASDLVPLCGRTYGDRGCHWHYDSHTAGHDYMKSKLTALAASLWAQFTERGT